MKMPARYSSPRDVRPTPAVKDSSARGWFSAMSKHLGLPAPRARHVRCVRDLPVPRADGISLLAAHWRPIGTENAPLLLVRTPYGRGGPTGLLYGRYFAHQGFQVVVQSCR